MTLRHLLPDPKFWNKALNRLADRSQLVGACGHVLFFLILYSHGYQPLIPTPSGVSCDTLWAQISEQGNDVRDSSRLAHQAADRYPF